MKLENDLCAHYLNPDFSEGFLNDDEIYTQVHVQQPYPIHKPFRSPENDVINKFHENSATYFNQLSTLYTEFYCMKKKIMNQTFYNSYATITKGLMKFCNTKKLMPYFTWDYCPLYATGLLEAFHFNANNYLIRPDHMNNLYITDMIEPWENNKLNLRTLLTDHVTGITGTVCNNFEIVLLLQHKNEVNLLKVLNVDVLELQWKKKFKQMVLDSKLRSGKLGVILSDIKFQLYDVETQKKINMVNCCNTYPAIRMEFVDDNNVAVLNLNSCKLVDQRCQDYKLFEPKLDNCNRLCSLKIDDNVVYLGSRHHLIKTDLRFFKNVEFCTHLMKSSPCYMDLTKCENNKMLCLASQKNNEKVLFTGNPIIGSLPFDIPSISDTLIECQLKNDILLKDNLKSRLQNSTCGMKILCNNEGTFLYFANCLGQLFTQQILNTSGRSGTTDSTIFLFNWVNELPQFPKTINLNNVTNLSSARFVLNKRIIDEQLKKFRKKNKKVNLFLNHFNNIYNKKNISSLAASFVSIWEEEEEEKEQLNLAPEVAPLDKVSSWIKSNYFFK